MQQKDGQNVANVWDDIPEWFQMIEIYISKYPDKMAYHPGERFDPTGMTVIGVFNYRDEFDMTACCTFTPEIITESTRSVTAELTDRSGQVFYTELTISVTDKVPVALTITKPPAKTAYLLGETFDPTGMEGYVSYDDDSTKVLTGSMFSFAPRGELTESDKEINVYLFESNTRLDAFVPIEVTAELTALRIARAPDETRYVEGETFDEAAMEIVAVFRGGYERKITGYTVEKAPLTLSDGAVTLSYSHEMREGGAVKTITKRASQPIRVMTAEEGYWGNVYRGNACIGENPKWDLSSMNTLYTAGGLQVGEGTHRVSANLIYVHGMPKRMKELCAGMPEGWKFDVQQFLIKDGKSSNADTYKYLDAFGFVHTFALAMGAKESYFDTSGTGMILEHDVITDPQGNKLRFTDGRLTEVTPARDPAGKKIVKYNADGNLYQIYDVRTPETYLSVDTYPSFCRFSVVKDGTRVRSLSPSFSAGKLVSLTEETSSGEEETARFVYDGEGALSVAYEPASHSAVSFTCLNDSMVNRGGRIVGTLATGSYADGQFTEAAHLQYQRCYVQSKDARAMCEVQLADEAGKKYSYLLNGERVLGCMQGTREGGYTVPRTQAGLVLTSTQTDATSAYRINGAEGYIADGAGNVTFDGLAVEEDALDGAKNLAVSCYLRHSQKKMRLPVSLTAEFASSDGIETVIVREHAELDPLACDVWQKLVIPFSRPQKENGSYTLKRLRLSVTGTAYRVSQPLLIASEKNTLFLCNGDLRYEDLKRMVYTVITQDSLTASEEYEADNGTDETLYMTQSDILRSLEWLNGKTFEEGIYISLCNGRGICRAAYVQGFDAENKRSFHLFEAEGSEENPSQNIFTETQSADGKKVTRRSFIFAAWGDKVTTRVTSGETVTETEEEYDRFGQVTRKKDAYGTETGYSYFADGTLQRVQTTAEGKTLTSYEAVQDAEGHISERRGGFGAEKYHYKTVYGVLDKITKCDYNSSENSYTDTDSTTTYSYDGLRRAVTRVQADDGGTTLGVHILSELANGHTMSDLNTKYRETYDPASDVTEIGIFEGSACSPVFRRKYLSDGQEDTYYGGTAYTSSTMYDALGRVTVRDGAQYEYDVSGDRTYVSVRDAEGISSETAYNSFGEVVARTRFGEDLEEEFRAEPSGGGTKYTFRGGESCSMDSMSDGGGRVQRTGYTVGETEVKPFIWNYSAYDGFGRVTKKEGTDGTCRFFYLTHGTRAYNKLTGYEYDSTRGSDPIAYTQSFEYDGQGNIGKETESFSCVSRATDVRLNDSITRTYSYDGLNRLVSASEAGVQYVYGYEERQGRMEHMQRGGSAWALAYDARGRLQALAPETAGTEGYTYEYDNFGNRTKKSYYNGGTAETYTWARGRYLASFMPYGKGTYTYEYGADGTRRKKVGNGTETLFYYDGAKLIGEDRGTRKLRYVYDREGMCGFRYYNGSKWSTYTYLKNALGDVRFIKDNDGNCLVKYSYDPFGNVTAEALGEGGEELAELNPIRYRGYYYDAESGLYYLLTRYYDPAVGQFISPDSFEYLDPHTVGGIDLYAYCSGNPVMYTDPYGTTEWWEWLLGGLIAAISIVGAVVVTVTTGGLAASVMTGVAVGATLSFTSQVESGELNWAEYGIDIATSAMSGAFSYGVGQIAKYGGQMIGTYLGNAVISGIQVSKVIPQGVISAILGKGGEILGGLSGGMFFDEGISRILKDRESFSKRLEENFDGFITSIFFDSIRYIWKMI